MGLLDVKVHGVRGAVGYVKVLPRVLVAGLGLVLFSGHPDGKACIVQPEAVEGPREAQLLDGDAQVPEEGVKVHCREPQRHHGQHYRQQGSPLPHSHLRQADAGGPQQDGGEQQGPLPALLVAAQIVLSFYQSGAVLRELDDQMGNFNAISCFQNGVERSLTALDDYRWEYGDTDALLAELDSAFSVTNAWLWRIDGSLDTVSEEQYLLYSAVCTTYDSYTALVEELRAEIAAGQDAAAAQLYYEKVSLCGGYLRQYAQQLLNTAISDAQSTYTTVSALSSRVKWAQTVVVGLCLVLGLVMAWSLMRLLTPVQEMIGASQAIIRGELETPDIPVPRQDEVGQLTDAFNHMKHSMAQQVNTLREKNEMEQALHQQETQALELQNRMERSRMQQLRSQIDPHFLFNTLNVILQTAGQEKAYRTQALITALSHLLRYSLMSNDEQVPLAREVRIVDEYYSIYHVRFGDRVKMRWCISDSIDLTETMVPSFILQPIVENAFKHGIAPKEEGGAVRIRITPLREQGLLRISVCDNGLGIEPEQLARLQAGLAAPGDRWEHIGVYNVAARLRLLDKRCRFEVRSHPGRGTAVSLYLPLVELTEEEDLDDDSPVDCG